VSNFRDWHIQLGLRFRALKLWFYLIIGAETTERRHVQALWEALKLAST